MTNAGWFEVAGITLKRVALHACWRVCVLPLYSFIPRATKLRGGAWRPPVAPSRRTGGCWGSLSQQEASATRISTGIHSRTKYSPHLFDVHTCILGVAVNAPQPGAWGGYSQPIDADGHRRISCRLIREHQYSPKRAQSRVERRRFSPQGNVNDSAKVGKKNEVWQGCLGLEPTGSEHLEYRVSLWAASLRQKMHAQTVVLSLSTSEPFAHNATSMHLA